MNQKEIHKLIKSLGDFGEYGVVPAEGIERVDG